MKKVVLTSVLLCGVMMCGMSQKTKEVLFIGNSYTGANNLPNLTKQLALSAGDVLVYDAHTPGGNRFLNHSVNTTVDAKINNKAWDYVVLQGQSVEVALTGYTFDVEVLPHVKTLASKIRNSNACSQPLFYMTWGRQNGHSAGCPTYPWICTYESMDSALRANYTTLADSTNGVISPVSAVWRYLRANTSINLYTSDGSHPSLAGSYAAACAFYVAIFEKDPTLITNNSSLSASDAQAIRNAAKLMVYDSLSKWHIGEYTLKSGYTYSATGNNGFQFTNASSSNATSYHWDFGDGNTSTLENPAHTYSSNGAYTVTLTAINDCDSVSETKTITAGTTGVNEYDITFDVQLFPNPTNGSQVTLSNQYQEELQVQVMNMEGRILKTVVVNKIKTLNLSEFTKGMYLVKVTNSAQQYLLKKLIIN